jgi:hypothetical protein
VSQIAPPSKLQEMLDSGIITEEQYINFLGTMNGADKAGPSPAKRPTTSVRAVRASSSGSVTAKKGPTTGKAKRAVVALVIIAAGAAGFYVYSHSKSSKAAAAVAHGHNARVRCLADARAVAHAVHAFDVAHRSAPITGEVVSIAPMGDAIDPGVPSTFAGGSQSKRLVGAGLLNSWPHSNDGYSIALATYFQAGQGGARLGEPVIYVPANSTHGVALSHEGAHTGCFSL